VAREPDGFGPLTTAAIELGNPTITEGNGVTYLHYNVLRRGA
jgi:hypothetical protein